MEELAVEQTKLDSLMAQYQVTLDIEDYNERILKKF
jgi:hypothetical protein